MKALPDIKFSIWHSYGIQFSRAEYFQHEFPPHFHEHFVIMKVHAGINIGVKERKRYEVDRDKILIINPGEIHTGSSFGKKRLVYDAIYPDVIKLQEVARRLEFTIGQSLEFERQIIDHPILIASLGELFTQASTQPDRLVLDSLVCNFFGMLYTTLTHGSLETGTLKSENSKFNLAKQYLMEHYQDPQISLTQLSGYVGISPYYLIRMFKKSCGLTPFEFVRNHRVEQAKKMIVKNGTSLTSIALDVGFYDQSHFIRSFKRVTGTTPMRCRTK